MKKPLILLLVLVLLFGALFGALRWLETSALWEMLARGIVQVIEQALPPVSVAPPVPDDVPPKGPPSDTDAPYDEDRVVAHTDVALQQRLLQAIAARQSAVEIGDLGYEPAALKEQVSRFFFTHPELFYVSNSYRYLTAKESTAVKTLELSYLYSEEQSAHMTISYKGKVLQITQGIPSGASDFDKVLYLHDYLVQNYAYDHEGAYGTPIRDAYHFFQTGRGVCQAYMLAMIALCEEVGIPCLPVTSDAMEHAWNLVKLDGTWYHVDVTWDDAGGEESDVYPSFVSYRYFLLSGEALYNGGRRVPWSAPESTQSTLYDTAPWRESTTKMVKMGERYYCSLFDTAEKQPKIYAGTPTQMAPVLTLEGVKWYGDPGKYYLSAWAGLAVWGERLLISTNDEFLFYDVERGVWQRLADLSAVLGERQIFGICDVDKAGVVRFVAAKDYRGEYEISTWRIPAT